MLSVLVIGAALVFCAGVASAEDTTSDSPRDLPEVGIDLTDRKFDQTLPFDTPFLLFGKVSENVRRIEAQYSKSRRFEQLNLSELEPAVPLIWERNQQIDLPEDKTHLVKFRIPVPPLEPQHYYRFQFTVVSVDAEDQLAFRVKAIELLDERLRSRDEELTASEVDTLRKDLFDNLKTLAPSGRILAATQGRILDPETAFQALAFKDQSDFVTIIEKQHALGLSLGNYEQTHPRLEQALRDIQGSPSLKKLLAALKADDSDPVVRAAAEKVKDFEALLGFDDTKRDRAAKGFDPETGEPATALDEMTPRAVLEIFHANYTNLEKAVLGLVNFLEVATGKAGAVSVLKAQKKLTDQDEQDLKQLFQSGGAAARARARVNALEIHVAEMLKAQSARTTAIEKLADEVVLQLVSVLFADVSTIGDFNTFARWYIGADAGFVYAWDIGEFLRYVGTNIYTRPVNKNIPLSVKDGLRIRFALTFGLTMESVADNSDVKLRTRDDLFNSQALVVGAGFRVTQSLRLGAGAVVLKKRDPNPTVSRDSAGITPYASFSFDFDMLNFLQRIGGLFGANSGGTK